MLFNVPRYLYNLYHSLPTLHARLFVLGLAFFLSICTSLLSACTSIPLGFAASATPHSALASACVDNPFGTRTLYLRGGFNSWNPAQAQRFTYQCNRFELVTRIEGEHAFKVGDEAWSADADFGSGIAPSLSTWQLSRKGKELHHRFTGFHKLVLNMTDTNVTPSLTVTDCPAPPLGTTTLYLRGTMNNWAALDREAFQFHCDAYYLNVNLKGTHEFKLADVAWTESSSFGAAAHDARLSATQAMMLVTGASSMRFNFSGEHTLRLAFPGGRPSLTIGPKTFADPRASSVTDPIALSVSHDSRSLQDKSPFGAVTAGSTVSFALNAAKGLSSATLVLEKRRLEGNQDILDYTEVARLPMQRNPGATSDAGDRFTASYAFKDIAVWGYYFEVLIGGKTYLYQNNQQSIHWTREQGANGIGSIEDKPSSASAIRRFRHSVYSADFTVPAWAKDAVYYYIFPERFRNGNKANDPKPGVTTYQDQGVELHTNWLDKPYKPGSGDGSDSVYNNDFFGGDIAGIIEKLDYIADLGANTLYITPMFKAASNHKYDTADYKNIDPHFGTNEDFTRLCDEARKRGLRVIVDTSLNHVGRDSLYFDRYAKHHSRGAFEGGQQRTDSPYADWFVFNDKASEPDKQYTGWVGIADLPELNKASKSYRDFAIHAPDSVTKLWMNRGAAGWRMDVAPWVPDDFWREWRRVLRAHRADAMTIAETWFDSSKFLLGDMFDSTMNYIFRNTLLDYAQGANAREIYHNIEYMREVYPPQAFYALMNLLSTHDQARSLHIFGYTSDSTDAAKISLAKQRLRLALFFQMMFPGAPAVYYGDEVGVTGGEDPYNRQTYPWADLGGKPDTELHAEFKRLIQLRQQHAVLRHGSIEAPVVLNDHVIAFLRRSDKLWALTATNNSPTPQTVTVTMPADAPSLFVDALSHVTVKLNGHQLSITVPPMYGSALFGESKP